MYQPMEIPVLEQFPNTLNEPWNPLSSDDFSYNDEQEIEKAWYHQTGCDRRADYSKCLSIPDTPTKIEPSLSDSHMDHTSFLNMKGQSIEEEAVLDTSVRHLMFNDSVPSELIVEQNGDVDHEEIVLVASNIIKQEGVIEEVIIASSVENEVIIDDQIGHLDTDHFPIGSSIDIGSDQIDDNSYGPKLMIDTDHYTLEEEVPTMMNHCAECGAMFKSRTLLKKHIKNEHTELDPGPKSKIRKTSSKEKSPSTKRYTCPSCPYSSQRRDKLDKHMEKHVKLDGVHPCGKRRHKPEALPQRHRHNAEEYKCEHCPYSCTVYRAMKKHLKIHLAGKQVFTLKLSCKICGKDRATDTDMQKHMKKHKKNEHFKCDLCNFTSVQLKKIIQHRRMHTGEKPHLCPHCNYRSARRDNLRSHVRRMHKRENMYIDTFNPNEESATTALF